MRFKSLLAALVALASIGLANPDPAAAFDHDRDRPEGWGHARPIRHWVYYPRYSHHYYVDPYAYQYSPRGYYPYYNSGYTMSASAMPGARGTMMVSGPGQKASIRRPAASPSPLEKACASARSSTCTMSG
mgnify:CR=1 FL=1